MEGAGAFIWNPFNFALGCPIQDSEMPFGSLLIYSKEPHAFGPDEVLLFESLAKEIGFGLRAIDRQHKLDDQIHEKGVKAFFY
ncbi:GAF domain-containing protein [Polynucleobacter necessarius]|uniref:GAF domain-containing protein n=1 Tax=Polynucleobacter necessarius TaxID=576610 RepID=UPI000E08CE01|nr:hypothetical protein [Polynucleobacter necessarius]